MIDLNDSELADLIGGLQLGRDWLRNQGSTGDSIQRVLDKLMPHMQPMTNGCQITMKTPGDHEDDPTLALWFTPQAIRDHFYGSETELSERIAAADNETVLAIGDMAINCESIYSEFHEVLVACAWQILSSDEEIANA